MGQSKFILCLVACLATVAGVGCWMAYRILRPLPPPSYVETTIGETLLRIHQSYARPGELTAGGLERVDIIARFPDFRAAGASFARDAQDVVYLRLQPQDQSLEPSERTMKLYARFLEQTAWNNPGGLIMRRFEKGSPYEREDLYLAPPEGRIFAARCMRPSQPPDGLPNTCITEFRLRGLDAQLRFVPDLLPEWERLMDGARGLIESLAR